MGCCEIESYKTIQTFVTGIFSFAMKKTVQYMWLFLSTDVCVIYKEVMYLIVKIVAHVNHVLIPAVPSVSDN